MHGMDEKRTDEDGAADAAVVYLDAREAHDGAVDPDQPPGCGVCRWDPGVRVLCWFSLYNSREEEGRKKGTHLGGRFILQQLRGRREKKRGNAPGRPMMVPIMKAAQVPAVT
jgi:hypothetical protein